MCKLQDLDFKPNDFSLIQIHGSYLLLKIFKSPNAVIFISLILDFIPWGGILTVQIFKICAKIKCRRKT